MYVSMKDNIQAQENGNKCATDGASENSTSEMIKNVSCET